MHKSIHYHLHCLRLIRSSIPLPIAIIIASSYIIPLFDYCNSLLFNLTDYKLIKLPRLQNAVDRCVHFLPRRSPDYITPLLKQLHWLPVPYRIKYKLSLTIHKSIHHNSPDYLAYLLHLHTPITTLQLAVNKPKKVKKVSKHNNSIIAQRKHLRLLNMLLCCYYEAINFFLECIMHNITETFWNLDTFYL